MPLALLLAHVGTVVVLALTPGPSTLLGSAHGMRYGARGTLPTIGGDLSANSLQMLAASVGLGAISPTRHQRSPSSSGLVAALYATTVERLARSIGRRGGPAHPLTMLTALLDTCRSRSDGRMLAIASIW